MKLAKNYEKYETIGEPYQAHGRWYTKINLNGQLTEVRLYSDQEYEKMYPSNLVKPYDALGFGPSGYITLIGGDTKPLSAWLRDNKCKFHKIFGWYLPNSCAIPDTIPAGLITVQLPWTKIANGTRLKPDEEISGIIDTLIYGPSVSTFVGKVGDRISENLTILKVIEVDTKFGKSSIHLMTDNKQNIYSWMTQSRKLIEGQSYLVKGTIKSHEVYKGQKRNVLSRCIID